MKALYAILGFFCLCFFVGCKGDNDPDFDCPVGSLVEATDVTLLSYTDFHNYNSYPVDNGIEHHASYEQKWGLAYFSLLTKITNVCPGEPLKIKSSLRLKNNDDNLRDSLLLTELQENYVVTSTLHNLPKDGNGKNYTYDVTHSFKSTGSNIDVIFGHCAIFPTKGSYPLDSTYFFDNFEVLHLSSTFKRR